MTKENSSGLPLAGVFLATFAWGIGPLLFLAVDVSTFSTIFYRMILWPPILFLVTRLRHVQINRETMRESLTPGLVFGISNIFGFVAWKETSIANATIIANLSAALILLAAPRLLHEHVSRRQVIFSVLSFVGVFGVVFGASGSGGAGLLGDGFALLNAVFWAIYFIASKRARTGGISTWAYLFGISISQLIVVVPVCLLFSSDIADVSLRDLGFLLGMALIPGVLGHGLMVWAHRYVNASVTSLIALLVPVISMASVWIVYGQEIAPLQMLGAAVVLLSLAGVVRFAVKASVIRDALVVVDPLLNSNP
ncbi:MAG: DMT family transporter [Ilumatobacteraceae bacterium]